MWYNWNGNIVKKASFAHENRSFKYGDGLFESMRVFNGKIFNRKSHENRLEKGLNILNFYVEKPISKLFDEVEELLSKNDISKGGFTRLMLYRDGKGSYTPFTNKASYWIECSKSNSNQFELQEKIVKTVFFTEYKKPISKLSNIKSNNALLYILASIHAKEQKADDAILINEKGNIIESTNANLFLVNEGKLYTPPLAEGPLDGTLRNLILQSFLVEERSVSIDDYEHSDEIFLTNAYGIKIVKSGAKAKEVVQQLNSLI
tara:strand:- start:287 stop:1069 length:783 start_codon:yes stop_codon:yes gene_type:complete